jgi:SAM-dependent methyltransferase
VRIENKISNHLVLEECGIWRLSDHTSFAYSDGSHTEHYLQCVFAKDIDLSSGSTDLETYIKDWPSEYHLSTRRAQLLAGFEFDPALKVLEVGCGCGAITRYLAENFDDVVAVEGSPARARLAQMRTRDCNNATVVCAPFQQLEFTEKFDLIVCVGVLEYSALFIDEEDPYDHVLRYFGQLLNEDGRVIIAIENQFGLKYFSSSREDHLKLMFEGIEGYPVFADKVKTFGRNELEQRLSHHFSSLEFCYPYPDYKIPDAIFSEEMLQSDRAGEMIANFSSRDYYGPVHRLFEESLATLELAKNNFLTTFANSFVVVAGKKSDEDPAFKQLGVMFSSGRREQYRMKTKFQYNEIGIGVEKTLLHPSGDTADARLTAHPVSGLWVDGYSLHTNLLLSALQRKSTLAESFQPVRAWLKKLASLCHEERSLPGNYVDCIWKNTFYKDSEIIFIDQEWEWKEGLSLEFIFIRSMFFFLLETQDIKKLPRYLKESNTRKLIRKVGALLDLKLSNADFANFAKQEAEFQALVYNKKAARERLMIRWYLANRRSVGIAKSLQKAIYKANLFVQSLRRYLRLP